MNLEKEIFEISLVDIMPNRFQPREIFDDEGLKELSESIKVHGVIQPIIVRKVGDKYEIIAGERRYRASELAGKQTIPALVRDIDDKEAAKIALLENLQRRDLSPIEEAKTYQTILKLDNITQDELARNLGKSQSAIANKIRLLNLDEEVQTALLNSQISERHARSLLNLDNTNQKNLLHKIISERLTVRQVDEEIMKLTGKMPEAEQEEETTNIEESINNTINEMKTETSLETVGLSDNVTAPTSSEVSEIAATDETFNEEPEEQEEKSIIQTQEESQENKETEDSVNNELPEEKEDKKEEVILPENQEESIPVPNMELPENDVTIPQPEINEEPQSFDIPLETPENIVNTIPEEESKPEIQPEIPLTKPEENVLTPNIEPIVEKHVEEEEAPRPKNIFDSLRIDNVTEEPVLNNVPETTIAPEQPIQNDVTTDYNNIYDLRFAINNFRQAVQNTEKFGFKVNVEEKDNPDSYQITINIDKNN